jgi:hypothetical protein
MGRFYCGHDAIMVRMPKKKLKKQSDKALRSQVKKEQAPARSAESSPRDDVNESNLPIVPRSPKEKAMRNRWLAFLTMVAVIAIALAHRGRRDDYVERYKAWLLEGRAGETLKTTHTAAVGYSAEHGRFPAAHAVGGPAADRLLDDPLSSGAITSYAMDYHSADSGTSYEVVAGRGLDLHATFSQIKSGS